jgi:hypothetical protein
MSITDQEIYREIFFSHSASARDRAIRNGGRFAYYTTSATAHLLLKNEELWMRNTAVMNDFTEVAHGLNWADSKVKCNTCKPVRSADAKHSQTVPATSA